jgi:hypothetical protein
MGLRLPKLEFCCSWRAASGPEGPAMRTIAATGLLSCIPRPMIGRKDRRTRRSLPCGNGCRLHGTGLGSTTQDPRRYQRA